MNCMGLCGAYHIQNTLEILSNRFSNTRIEQNITNSHKYVNLMVDQYVYIYMMCYFTFIPRFKYVFCDGFSSISVRLYLIITITITQ